MKKFRIEWHDAEGNANHGFFLGLSATEALATAMEDVDFLKLHPHLITRVIDESKA